MRSLALAVLLGAVSAPLAAFAQSSPPPCGVSADLVRLANPLPRVAKKLAAGQPIKIVAIGSSSTAGAGASTPANTYPSRLESELASMFPRQQIVVLNRGVGGEETRDMLRRFDAQVIAEKPDLVLWQMGTNAVIRDHALIDHGSMIREGLDQIKRTGADIVMIDPQYAPKVIVKPDSEHMVELIGVTAKTENVDLFRRFALMRHWHDEVHLSFEAMVSPDGLHMNDWSYGCLAKNLAAAIAEAATRPVAQATARAQ